MKPQIEFNPLLDGLQSRAAIKSFAPPAKEDPEIQEWIDKTKEIIRLSPSGYGLQPYHFLIIRDPEIREKLKAHSYGQSQITDSHFLVVFCAKSHIDDKTIEEYLKLISQVRETSLDSLSGMEGMIKGSFSQYDQSERTSWAAKQAYIALGNALTSLALMGIDSCPMEGFDPQGYDQVLGLKEKNLAAVALMAVGKRSESDTYSIQPKVRFSKEDLFTDL